MKTWLDAIDANGFGGWTRTMMIGEAQRTRFPGDLPAEFEFLGGGFADLGFDRLGLPEGELDAVRLAFVGTGVAVPGTPSRLRFVRPVLSVVEPADGAESATLPIHWRRGVFVLGHGGMFVWVGKAVPAEWLSRADLREYEDAGDGWARHGENERPTPGGRK